MMGARSIVIFLGLVAILTMATLAYIGERAEIIVEGPTPVWVDKKGDGKKIASLQGGMVVPIMACIDVKSYFVYRVSILDKTGYVVDGLYHVRVGPIWSDIKSPIVFNCH
jgi:hypothetical protein